MNETMNSSSETRRTVVDEGTHFKGDLVSTCPIDVRGRVEGEIQAPSLTVSNAGSVHGKGKLGAVRSEGELSGEFEAETVELSGTVKDNTVIRARSLEVKLSSKRGQQIVFGDCELLVGDEPTEHDVVEEPEAHQMSDEVQPPSEAPEARLEGAAQEENAAAAQDDDEDAEGDADDTAEARAHDGDSEHPEASEAPGAVDSNDEAEREANGGDPSSGWSQSPSQPPPAE